MKNLPQKVRSKKLSSRVDLTAMVSVSFLLIIFFMVTIELRKSRLIEYPIYNEGCGPIVECGKPDENRTMTILLDKDNKIITYSGLLFVPIEAPKEVAFGRNGIRKELFRRNNNVLAYSANLGKPGRGVEVVIKPSKKSNYGNLVDILDEIKITGIKSYLIVDQFSPEEEKLLASN
ncbi:biopolymer transporter ExbD [Flavobacterium sp. DG2-3]|uniref:ExbD/TolR family protein n=1 Tax=Flavobacterium sp. DG2-3 TaxID=3068317 RepID=UPI00273EC09F|nr:biopolymer transporter ExbD [Flavobacterium sp. DG2-3]MDP5198751.1 biopolymer transporter ExbD [Flavobacterium sp. DG2-3]